MRHLLLRLLVALTCATCPPPAALAAGAATKPAAGADWPQFLGPTRDGVYAGADVADGFPPGGPNAVWKVDVGEGWAAPMVAGGRVLAYHRVADEAVLDCLDAGTGKPLWRAKHPTDYVDGFGFDAGPRATPAVAGGRAFTLGAEGTLAGWELATGRRLWAVDVVRAYGARKGFFGLAPSPLVEGDNVIVTVGGRDGKTVVAFDAGTGREAWAAGGGDAEAGYASPTAATIGGRRAVLAVTRAHLDVLDAAAGARVARLPFRSRQDASVNAATPLVVGGEVFVSASYGVGAKLLRFDAARPGEPAVVWANDESMSNHYATCVVRDRMLYGFHGRQEQGPALRCVAWDTGEVRWSRDEFGAGTVTLAGDKLLILTEKGELVLAAASPDGYRELGRARVLGFDTRAYPAVAGGRLYARGKDKLVCVDLRRAGQ